MGPTPGLKVVSSCFLMALPEDRGGARLIYSDCAVVPDPDPEALADIAEAAAASCRVLLGEEPRVALLSFSTLGSARHPRVEKVRAALAVLRRGGSASRWTASSRRTPPWCPRWRSRKAPGSPVAGRANVLVFPDLDAGNISYKLTERLGGRGRSAPCCKGSRRRSTTCRAAAPAEDIVDVIAVTALDAAERRRE